MGLRVSDFVSVGHIFAFLSSHYVHFFVSDLNFEMLRCCHMMKRLHAKLCANVAISVTAICNNACNVAEVVHASFSLSKKIWMENKEYFLPDMFH